MLSNMQVRCAASRPIQRAQPLLQCQSANSQPGRASTQKYVPQESNSSKITFGRRDALLQLVSIPTAVFALSSWVPGIASAAEATASSTGTLTLQEYDDGPDSFIINIPKEWEAGTGQASGARFGGSSGARRALAWYPAEDANKSNVSIVVTNVGADFTSLGSFNPPQAFGEALVNSMDRSFLGKAVWGHADDLKAGIQEAKLLSAKERNKLYYIDYSLKKPGESEPRIFQSAVALGFNGTYNRLFTVTAQCSKSDFPMLGDTLTKVVESFKPPKAMF